MEKLEASSEEPKTHKRKLDKRLILSLTKPSFLLTLGRVHIRYENRQRLCYLLEKLVKQHNWAEASGVLSLLLKGTSNDCSADLNRLKYSVWLIFFFLSFPCIYFVVITLKLWSRLYLSLKNSFNICFCLGFIWLLLLLLAFRRTTAKNVLKLSEQIMF